MQSNLAPGIVVLNSKYFSRDTVTAAQVGASSFTFSVLRVLLDAHILSGIVLYSRNEDLNEAYCEIQDLWQGVLVVKVNFNFRMAQSTVASALSAAFDEISLHATKKGAALVYYQTDTLLQFHPHGYQYCVTHHGPFVSHFSEQFTPALARVAFGGDSGKVEILDQQQRSGIRRLLQDSRGTVLAHSGLQQRILEEEGLSTARFKSVRPPIGVPLPQSPNILSQQMQEFIAASEVLLYTAVARLDYFKNAELLLASGLELMKQGLPVRVLIVGDAQDDQDRRQVLLNSVPRIHRHNFLILPRLPKDHLYALFAATRRNGIFLCPSRYETLGITPLEAAASGVTTLMTETPNVEALAFMPLVCRVGQDKASIASRVELIYQDGIDKWAEMIVNHVRPRTSLEGFGKDLLQAWAEMTASRLPQKATAAQSRKDLLRQMGVPRLATSYVPGGFVELLRHSPLSPGSLRISM